MIHFAKKWIELKFESFIVNKNFLNDSLNWKKWIELKMNDSFCQKMNSIKIWIIPYELNW